MASPLGRSGGGPLPALNWEGCWLCRRVIFEASLASSTGAGCSPHSPLNLHLQGKSDEEPRCSRAGGWQHSPAPWEALQLPSPWGRERPLHQPKQKYSGVVISSPAQG